LDTSSYGFDRPSMRGAFFIQRSIILVRPQCVPKFAVNGTLQDKRGCEIHDRNDLRIRNGSRNLQSPVAKGFSIPRVVVLQSVVRGAQPHILDIHLEPHIRFGHRHTANRLPAHHGAEARGRGRRGEGGAGHLDEASVVRVSPLRSVGPARR